MMQIFNLLNARIAQAIKVLWQQFRPQKVLYAAEIAVETTTVLEETEEGPPKIGIANAVSIHEILDFLPGYFNDLKALRKFDPSTYEVMATLGGVVVPENSWFSRDLLSEFLKEPPLMRCIFFEKKNQLKENHKNGKYGVAIMYMILLKGGMTYVAREGYYCHLPVGICYRVVLVYNTDIGSTAQSFFVHYDENYKMSVMKENKVVSQVIRRSNKAPKGRRGSAEVFHRKTITPRFLIDLVAENNEDGSDIQTTDELAATLCNICLSAKRPSEAILVRAQKSGLLASWTIDRQDGKRFFAKRVTGSATDGKRKRILHYVGNFARAVDGRTSYVREHYRGERSFSWMGYGIEVSGLGFHHKDFYNASIETIEVEGAAVPRGFVSMEKSVGLIKQYYSSPYPLPKLDKPYRKRAS